MGAPCAALMPGAAALALMILLLVPQAAIAQSETEPAPGAVNVGVYVSPPFVVAQNGTYDGMAIELWEAIAGKLNLATRYVAYPTIRDLVNATRDGEIDAAVTNLTITRNRAERIAFTQPWYDAGLRIMVPQEGTGGFWSVVSGLGNAGHLRAYAWLLLVIVAGTIGLTLFDRKFDPAFPKRWRDGVAESFYHVVSVATAGRAARKNLFGWLGRFWQAAWLVVGVGVVAYITSSVTSVMTTVSLESGIHSLADLPGKTVGVFTGSVAEDYVTELGIASRSYSDIDAAAAAMNAGTVEAIVGDAPILEHFAHENVGDDVAVVGNIFHPDKYGFAFLHDSDLTHPVTLRLLEFIEDGTVERLRSRYFGSTP
ncbi:transporter substrate-binding domain-containing protein [Mesorhizobium xinjiangense]|uniref:transporter substrate-binding domain-containing protein n=1 Tax=Mesorhizobium xinjiangense TaxID=2678685 RepID=UPI001F38A9C7|nr:transporter substrate-binding domain-containing protein [Mesorhizobium xinjiangense]